MTITVRLLLVAGLLIAPVVADAQGSIYGCLTSSPGGALDEAWILSVVKAPDSAALAAGQLRVIRGDEWRERPDGPPAYKRGDEFVGFLAWQPEPDRFGMPDPSWMVPVKTGLIELKFRLKDGNPDGKTVDAFLTELRSLAKR
jgi:hypothetical protein